MVERGVDDALRSRRAAREAVEVVERAAVGLGPGGQRLVRLNGAREAHYLVARANQFLNNGRADEARGAGDENTHVLVL